MASALHRLLRQICASHPKPPSRTLTPNDVMHGELLELYAEVRKDVYQLFLSVCYDAHQVRCKGERDVSKRATAMQCDGAGECGKDHTCNFNSILAFLDAIVSEAQLQRYKSIGCMVMARMTGLELLCYNDSLNCIEITMFEFWAWLINIAALVDVNVPSDDEQLLQQRTPSATEGSDRRMLSRPLLAAKARQFLLSHLFRASSILLPDVLFESVGLIGHAGAVQLQRKQARMYEHSTSGQLRTKFLRNETEFFQVCVCERVSAHAVCARVAPSTFFRAVCGVRIRKCEHEDGQYHREGVLAFQIQNRGRRGRARPRRAGADAQGSD
jgi:hypothetical protein